MARPSIAPNPQLARLLLEAYRPCVNFGVCREAVWNPSRGHIPRGFVGATGALAEVEVVMVFAEPGHPHELETYAPKAEPEELLMAGVRHTHACFASGQDQFHRNVRWFLSRLFPELPFARQLRRAWLTEGRLCSVESEIGGTKDRRCASHYLARQLALLPNATVVAFGGKAKDYMKMLGGAWIGASALSPPGANFTAARPSWEAAIAAVQARRAVAVSR